MTKAQKQAYAHYLTLWTFFFSEGISKDGRAWLVEEINEMESDMDAMRLAEYQERLVW
jgi:uncharacterized protein YpmB